MPRSGGFPGGQTNPSGRRHRSGVGAAFVDQLGKETATGPIEHGSVTNTYARAFADVVFDGQLDPAKTLHEASRVARVGGRQRTCGKSGRRLRSGGAEAGGAGCDCRARRHLAPAAQLHGGADRPPAGRIAGAIVHSSSRNSTSAWDSPKPRSPARASWGTARTKALEAQVAKLTGKKVRARYQDAACLGGAIVRVGSTIYDGSVRGQLERMREAISTEHSN